MHPATLRPYENGTDYDETDIALVRFTMPDGQTRAALLPARARRLPPEVQEAYVDLQRLGLVLEETQRAIDELALELRDRGVSWSLIGFAVGVTGETARTRWGDV